MSAGSAVVFGARRCARPRRLLHALACSAAFVVLASACNARRSEHLTGREVATTPALERGQQVFAASCSPCHPGGEAGLGPALNDKPLPGFMMALQIRVGLGAMPGFADDEIADDELDALIAYLEALR